MKVALCFKRFTLLTLLRLLPMLTVFTLLKQLYEKKGWYAYKPGMDAPPRGEGGVPRPAPPRKNDQNRGEVAGQNIGPNLNFLQ